MTSSHAARSSPSVPALPARLIGTRPAIHVDPVVIDLPPVNANEARAFHAFTVRPAS